MRTTLPKSTPGVIADDQFHKSVAPPNKTPLQPQCRKQPRAFFVTTGTHVPLKADGTLAR